MTCTTDQSSGIKVTGTDYTPPVTTLYVHGFTGPINPSVGDPGISLTNGSSLNTTINSGNGFTPGNILINVTDRFGIRAQSQGSAGRDGENTTESHRSTSGGAGSIGGNVTVNTIENANSSTIITTAGSNAIGILAISQGGSGGAGNEVSVTSCSNINTQGNNSHGILAQSIGGGGSGGFTVSGAVAIVDAAVGLGGGTIR